MAVKINNYKLFILMSLLNYLYKDILQYVFNFYIYHFVDVHILEKFINPVGKLSDPDGKLTSTSTPSFLVPSSPIRRGGGRLFRL